jgi:hypothetical protein
MDEKVKEVNEVKNRGKGAGGKNTNVKGKAFEKTTDCEVRLLSDGYEKKIIKKNSKTAYYLRKIIKLNDIEFIVDFVQQYGLKFYMKKFYNIEMIRNPDEAYIITEKHKSIDKDKKILIKILEKKEQSVEGSVETKLWSSPSLKREYEILLGNKFIVEYGLCINNFLKQKISMDSKDSKDSNNKQIKKCNKKYEILKKILEESNIDILYGDDNDYLETLTKWIIKLHIK